MRSGSIALGAAAAAMVPVLAPAAGTAYAHDDVRVAVSPATARPGADVDLRLTGCASGRGTAKSPAFVADVELRSRDRDGRDGQDGGSARGKGGTLFGDTSLKPHLDDGTYRVTVFCDGHDHHDVGTVEVRRHEEPPHRPTHHASPVAPVHAGGGGTAAFAAPVAPGVAQTAGEEDLGTPYTLLGLGLAAVAAAAVAVRGARRRAGRGVD